MNTALTLAAVLASIAIPGRAEPGRELSVGKAIQFLEKLYDPDLGLLRQDPRSQDYWIYPDNFLAAKALAASRPELARKIRASMVKHAAAKPAKIAVLGNGAGKLDPLLEPELVTLSKSAGKRVRTERPTSKKVDRWTECVDLLLLQAMAERASRPKLAASRLDKALRMWDGKGFLDKTAFFAQVYSASKLSLALLAAGALRKDIPLRGKILEQLARQQDPAGGFVADYGKDGKPVGVPSAEATSLALLGLAAAANAP